MPDHHATFAPEAPISRRDALKRTTLGTIALATGACVGATEPEVGGDGRLTARVTDPTQTTSPGVYPLGLASGRDGLLYVPVSYKADTRLRSRSCCMAPAGIRRSS